MKESARLLETEGPANKPGPSISDPKEPDRKEYEKEKEVLYGTMKELWDSHGY